MNPDILVGIGLVGRAVADLLVDKNTTAAFTDFMAALGHFNVHHSIQQSMQASQTQLIHNMKDAGPETK